MFKNLIFDWSGTLVDDLDLTLEASNYVFSQYGKANMDRNEFRSEFQLPYPDYYARVLPEADLNELEDHFRHAFRISREPVCVLPHAREFMEFCRSRGIRCFALTSVDAKEFDIQCRSLGMFDYFEAIHAGIRHKTSHIHKLLDQHGLIPSETAFIGDMQHDMETAHHGGITSIAVLTGYNDASQLEKSQPDMMVPHLGILQNLLRKFPSATACDHQDSMKIKGLVLFCRIGVPDEERAVPQEVRADITLKLSHPLSGLQEDLAATVNYDTLARNLAEEAARTPRKLIETLAEDLVAVCMDTPHVSRASVTIRKYILPQTEHVSVTVHSH